MAKKQKEVVLSPIAQLLTTIDFKTIIGDEIHSVKNKDSQRSMAYTKIVNAINPEYHIGLSGTTVLNRPVEYTNVLNIMRYLDPVFGGFIKFTIRYCEGHKGRFGWDAKGASNLDELNTRLREAGIYIRREKKDVLPELPEKTRSFGTLPINNRTAYLNAKENLEGHIREEAYRRAQRDEKFQRSLVGMSEADKAEALREYCINLVETAMKAEILTQMQKLESLAAVGKLPAAIEWVQNFCESGKKLIIMASSKALLEGLCAAFPNALRIVSEMSGAERLAAANKFQNDDSVQLIICSMGKHAGASPVIGLNLQSASDVVFFSIGWNPALMIQCEDRALRIGSKNAVTCYYLPAKDTFEEEKLQTVLRKWPIVEKAVSGDYKATDADEDTQLFFLREIF